MNSKTVVVLGGGIGGIVATNELRSRLPRAHRVVLVERNPQHAFAASFLWLMTGDRKPEQISRPLRQLLRPGIELVQAEVCAIDLNGRRVETSAQALSYDYLVIALGAEFASESIPGLSEAAHTFYSFEGAATLRDALQTFTGGTVAVVVTAAPYKCPGAPHEGAMLIANHFLQRGIRDKVDIRLYTWESQPMAVAGPMLGRAVTQMLESKGIAFHPLHKLTAVNAQTRELHFDDKEPVAYDLLVAIPPHRSPAVVRDAGLTNEAGWIPVDCAILKTQYENVYALGDVTSLPIPGRWEADVPLMLPKAGVFAHAQAEVVARRIAAEVKGAPPKDTFCGDGYCMLEAGEDLAGFAFGNFFAEPAPQVEMRHVGKTWHLGKVLLEKWWLTPFGLKRGALRLALKLGGKWLRIPVDL